MSTPSLNSQLVKEEVYRGWTLYVRWFPPFALTDQGWLCYPIEPGKAKSARSLSLGRFPSSEIAFEKGRAWVDQVLDPAPKGKRPPARRRRERD